MKAISFIGDTASTCCILLLIFASIILNVKTGFFLIKNPIKTAKKAIAGAKKEQIRAMISSLGGTLGVGNISGVAFAIIAGGEGTVFWMWISAIFMMCVKFSEVTLAQKYKKVESLEKSAYNYISIGAKMPKLSMVFSVFALGTAISMGALAQSGAISASLCSLKWSKNFKIAFALIISIFTFALGIAEKRRITSLLSLIVPLMSFLYVTLALYVILSDIGKIPSVFLRIISSAFNFKSISLGGFSALRYGVMKGLFSNEAGAGTAPMAHTSVESDFPARQGVFGAIEVFIDTIVVCTLSSFAFISYYDVLPEKGALESIFDIFSSFFGDCGKALLFGCIFFFSYATVILWSYYVRVILCTYSFSSRTANAFVFVYSFFVFIGFFTGEKAAFSLSDLTLSVMSIINSVVLILLSGEVKKEKESFFTIKRHTE